MSHTTDLLDRVKKVKGMTTDTEAAAFLGLTKSAVSVWRRGREGSPAAVEKLANTLGENAAYHIMIVTANQQRDADSRRTLEKIAATFAKIAALLVLTLVPYSTNAQSVKIHNYTNAEFDISTTNYTFTYIKRQEQGGPSPSPDPNPERTTEPAA